MAPTPLRTLRVAADPWDAALQRAREEGVSMSDLVRGWLADYAAGKRRVGPGRPGTIEISRAEAERLRALIDGLLK